MTLFDLLFLAIFLGTLIALIAAAYQSVRGRLAKAGKLVLGVAGFWAVYLGVVAAVSLSTPRRTIAIGEERCFDDWCITVERISGAKPIAATLRVSSEAKRVTQAAPDTTVYVEDSHGVRYPSKPENGQPTFATRIGPGESYETVHQFDVPDSVTIVGLVVRHGQGGPGSVIIGGDDALFHQPAIVKFP